MGFNWTFQGFRIVELSSLWVGILSPATLRFSVLGLLLGNWNIVNNVKTTKIFVADSLIGSHLIPQRDHLGKPGIDGRIILGWICRKWEVGIWTGSSWFRIGTGGGRL